MIVFLSSVQERPNGNGSLSRPTIQSSSRPAWIQAWGVRSASFGFQLKDLGLSELDIEERFSERSQMDARASCQGPTTES